MFLLSDDLHRRESWFAQKCKKLASWIHKKGCGFSEYWTEKFYKFYVFRRFNAYKLNYRHLGFILNFYE